MQYNYYIRIRGKSMFKIAICDDVKAICDELKYVILNVEKKYST